MQVGIDRHHAIESARQQLSDDLLAHRFACMKGRVLAHIGEIGRDQHQPRGAIAPQGLGGKQQRQQLVVRLIERGKDDRGRPAGPTVTRNSPSGKAMHVDLMQRQAEPRRQPPRRRDAEAAGTAARCAHRSLPPPCARLPTT